MLRFMSSLFTERGTLLLTPLSSAIDLANVVDDRKLNAFDSIGHRVISSMPTFSFSYFCINSIAKKPRRFIDEN